MADKTNVMRILDGMKIPYTARNYEQDPSMTGEEIAELLGEEAARVFKTLVTRGRSGQFYVFVIPVEEELDLKKAAKASGEKDIAMIKQKELLPLTGYVHGGCSPIGMKKSFPTFIQEDAELYETIFVSGGKLGHQIEIAPEDLRNVTGCLSADLVKEAVKS